MRLQLLYLSPSHVNHLKMKCNYKGPHRLSARGCWSATEEILRSIGLMAIPKQPIVLKLLNSMQSKAPSMLQHWNQVTEIT